MKLEDIEKASGLHARRSKLLAMKHEIQIWHADKNTDRFTFGPEVADSFDSTMLFVDVLAERPFLAVVRFLQALITLAEQDLLALGVDIFVSEYGEEEGEEQS